MAISNFACISQDAVLSFYENKQTNKLILSSNHTEGFYEFLPLEKNIPQEHHLFFVVKREVTCFQDRVFRAVSEYENKNNVDLHVYPGRLKFKNVLYNCIRFRENELDEVMKVIPYFERKGIQFVNSKKINPYISIIQFKKHIEAEEIKPDIFKDKEAKHIYYLPLPFDMEYDDFKNMVTYIRNNCDFKSFDASLVYIINHNYKVNTYAMIYSPSCEEERLTEFEANAEKAIKSLGL